MGVELSPETEAPPPASVAGPESFAGVVALFSKRREAILHNHLVNDVHLVHFEPGRIEFRAATNAPADLALRVSRHLGSWTGTTWLVTLSTEAGAPTLRAQEEAAASERRGAAADHPLVQAALEAFPGAIVTAVFERDKQGEASGIDEDNGP